MLGYMTFYRVTFTYERGTSAGYTWHTSRRSARAAAVADFNEDPEEYNNDRAQIDSRIEAVEVKPTRVGILETLQHYASYPDNG